MLDAVFEELLGKMFSDSVAWVSEGKWQKLYAAFVASALGLLMLFVASVAVGLLLAGLGAAALNAAASHSIGAVEAIFTAAMVPLALSAALVIALAAVAYGFLNLKLIAHSLSFQGYGAREIIIPTIVRYWLLGLVVLLKTVLCWNEKKWLLAGVAAAFVFIASIFAANGNQLLTLLGFAISILVSLPYWFGVVKHAVRLSLSQYYFVLGQGVRQSAQSSWEATSGRGLAVFGAIFVFALAWGIANNVVETLFRLIPMGMPIFLILLWPAINFVSVYGYSGMFAFIDKKKSA